MQKVNCPTPVSVILTDPKGEESLHVSQSAAARSLGVSVGNIHDCVKGIRRSVRGYKVRRA